MFALIIISGLLLPMLYMVTTSFQQPGQIADAGRAGLAGVPADRARTRASTYPIYTVPLPTGRRSQLMLVEPGRESSTFVDPTDPTATPIEWAGPLADAGAGVEVRAARRQLHDRRGTS